MAVSLRPKALIVALSSALASGVLYSLAYPGVGIWPLAFIAIVPILLGTRSKTPFLSTFAWLLYGMLFWSFSLYWLYFYMLEVLALHAYLCVLLMLLLLFASSIPYAITGYLHARFKLFEGLAGAFVFAAFLAAFVAWFPTVFPSDISLSLYHAPILIQIGDIGGAFLIHFFVLFSNALIAYSILYYKDNRVFHRPTIAAFIILFALVTSYGAIRLHQFKTLYKNTPKAHFVTIGYVQPNIPGDDLQEFYGPYMSEEEKRNNFETTRALTQELIETHPNLDLIVWPETPIDFPVHNFPSIKRAFKKLLISPNHAPIMYVSMFPMIEESKTAHRTGENSLYYVLPNGTVSNPYAKANLIPFAEYLPGEKYFPILRKFFPYTGAMTPGIVQNPLKINDRLTAVPLICYDGIFSNYVRKFSQNGGNVLIAMDNSSNFGPTRASDAHLAAVIYRTIENRMPMIRVNNSGISCAIQSSGKIIPGSTTPKFIKTAVSASILPGDIAPTPFQSWGFLLPYIFTTAILYRVFRKKWLSQLLSF